MSRMSRSASVVSVLLFVPALLFAQETYPIKVWPKVTGGSVTDSVFQFMITEQLRAAEVPIAPLGVYPEDIAVLEIHTSVLEVGERVYDVVAVVTTARRGVSERTAPIEWLQFDGVADLGAVAREVAERMIAERAKYLERQPSGAGDQAPLRQG